MPPVAADDIEATAKLSMLFITDQNEERLVSFTEPRLGLSLKNGNPVTVGRVVEGGHAHSLGVQTGWAIKQVEGRDVTSITMPTQVITDFVKSNTPVGTPRDVAALKIDFYDFGEVHTHIFSNSPLGLEFDSEKPHTVAGVANKTFAHLCGIRPGWKIIRVNGEDVRSQDWPSVCRAIVEKSASLPKASATPIGTPRLVEQPCG